MGFVLGQKIYVHSSSCRTGRSQAGPMAVDVGLRSPLRVGCLHPVSCSPDVGGRDSGERAFSVDGHEVRLLWRRFALTEALVRQMTWWRFAGVLAALSAVG